MADSGLMHVVEQESILKAWKFATFMVVLKELLNAIQRDATFPDYKCVHLLKLDWPILFWSINIINYVACQ
jgi:hypothetical protein